MLQVNLKEQGQLIRQDEFLVTFRKKKCFRHIFLFQELILFSKTRKTDVGNDTYIYKQSFKVNVHTAIYGSVTNKGWQDEKFKNVLMDTGLHQWMWPVFFIKIWYTAWPCSFYSHTTVVEEMVNKVQWTWFFMLFQFRKRNIWQLEMTRVFNCKSSQEAIIVFITCKFCAELFLFYNNNHGNFFLQLKKSPDNNS